jgi:S-adenosylhomocysteine hydrolase
MTSATTAPRAERSRGFPPRHQWVAPQAARAPLLQGKTSGAEATDARRVWASFADGHRGDGAGDGLWDLAALFVEGGLRGLPLTDEQKRILVRPIHETSAGAFLGRIAVEDAERVLLGIVDIDLYRRFAQIRTLGDEEMPFHLGGDRLATNIVSLPLFGDDEFAREVAVHGDAHRGLDDPRGAAAWEELRRRFCRSLARGLADAGPDPRAISLAHIDACRGEDASRIVRIIAAALRDEAPASAALAPIEEALRAPDNDATLARLAEMLLLSPVADGRLAVRPPSALDRTDGSPARLHQALWQALPGRARVERDLRAHLPAAVRQVLEPFRRPGAPPAGDVLDVPALRRALGAAAVELVLSLRAGAAPLSVGKPAWEPVLWLDIEDDLAGLDGAPRAASALLRRDIDIASEHFAAADLAAVTALLLATPPPALAALVASVWEGDPAVFGVHPDTVGAPPDAMAALQSRLREVLRRGGTGGEMHDAHLAAVAIIELLCEGAAPPAGPTGAAAVDLKALGATYGEWLPRLALRLKDAARAAAASGAATGLDLSGPLAGATTPLSASALAAIGAGLSLEAVKARMPVFVEMQAELAAGAPLASFDGAAVLQHLLPPACAGIEGLSAMGLPPDKLRVLGKSYSTKDAAFAWLAARGFPLDAAARADDNKAEDAKARLAEAGRRVLQGLFAGVTAAELADPGAARRFLLVDEGGVFLRLLHTDPELIPYARLCVAVEHTENGMQVLDDLEKEGVTLTVPVVRMAQSWLKKLMEAPAIGESIVDEALRMIDELPPAARPDGRQAAVVGYGDVGQHVVGALERRQKQVTALDIADGALARAAAAGVPHADARDPARRAEALARADLVFTATGRPSIAVDEFARVFKPGAIAIAGGSGNHELGVGALDADALAAATAPEVVDADGRAQVAFRGASIDTGSFFAPAKNRHLVFRPSAAAADGDGRDAGDASEVLVLYGGGVVNLRRGLPPEYSQLIRLLVAASCREAARLAATGAPPGRYDIPDADQEAIRQRMEDFLRARGFGSLERPDFRGLMPW